MPVCARDLFQHIVDHFLRPVGVEFGLHAPQSHADNVAVVQFRARAFGAQLPPQAMRQVDVLRPEARGVRAEVEEDDILLIFQYDFER